MTNEELKDLNLEELESVAGGYPIFLADDARLALAQLKQLGMDKAEAYQQLANNKNAKILTGPAEERLAGLAEAFRSLLARPLVDNPVELKSPVFSALLELINKQWDTL